MDSGGVRGCLTQDNSCEGCVEDGVPGKPARDRKQLQASPLCWETVVRGASCNHRKVPRQTLLLTDVQLSNEKIAAILVRERVFDL